ncbi:MAG: universal stress protein, partial [Bacteroidia bacterium]
METILVPTDFSPASANAIDYATGLARLFRAKLVLLHVDAPRKTNYVFQHMEMVYRFSGFGKTIPADNSRAHETLRILKSGLCEKHGDIMIDCMTETGAPYDVITRMAREQKADLIVMGIPGEAATLNERLYGSVSVKVARNQNIPTFIIPEQVKYNGIQKISFACDLKKTEETGLAYTAKSFSRAFDAELEVVNIEPPEEEISSDKSITNFFIEDVLENTKHTTIHISGHDVAFELEDYFSTFKTDVIMLSPRRHAPWHY